LNLYFILLFTLKLRLKWHHQCLALTSEKSKRVMGLNLCNIKKKQHKEEILTALEA